MQEELQALISAGEQVLLNETRQSDIPYPNTVSGPQCDVWKGKCLALFTSVQNEKDVYSEIVRLASKRVLTRKQANQLLELLVKAAED